MKIAIYLAGGHEKAFKQAEKELKQYLTTKMWSGHEIELYEVQLGDSNFLHDMHTKYQNGYKLISMGRYSNNLIADLSGTNVIEPSRAHLKGAKTVFDEEYYNKKPITLDYNDGMFILNFEVLPMMHPLYSISNKEQAGVAKWVSTIRKYLGFEGIESQKECQFALTYKELYDYVMPRYNSGSEVRVSYDIESNFVPAHMVGFDIVGFSLSFGNNSGIYAVLEAREYQMTSEDRQKSLDLLKWLLSNPKVKVVVHNSMYELPTTLNRIDYEIPRERLDDTLVMSKIINSGFKGGNSLKAQAVYRLGYTDWSKDLDIFRSALMDYVKLLRGTASSKKYLEAETRMEFQEDSLCNNTEALRVLCKYYDEESAVNMLKDYRDDLIQRINSEVSTGEQETHILSYGYLPMKLLATYGAIDSIATIELYEFFTEEFKRLSELFGIDLNDGYSLWMESMYAAYKLELNSSRWDESQASLDEEEFRRIMKESMIQLLHSDSPSMKKHVFAHISVEAKAKFLEDPENVKKYIESSPLFQGYTGTGRYRYSGKKLKNGELVDAVLNVAPNKVDEVLKAFNVSKNAIDMFCRIYVENKIKELDKLSLEELQEFLNPAGDKGKDLLVSILHEEFLAGSRLILDIIAFKNTESFRIEVANGRFSESEVKFIEKVATFNKNWKIPEKGKFFDEVLEELSSLDLGASMSRMITNAGKWRSEGITEPDLTALYELYTIAGFDIDTDYKIEGSVFNTLFHLRRYKKVLKMLDVYINGDKLGRNQVYVVDKDELESGKKLVRRKRKYVKGEVLADNEELLYQGTWNPNSVMTGRWSSPLHTLPASSDPKRYMTSRYKGGCVSMPDFCLKGDTKIPLVDGSVVEIKDLVGRDEFYVYAYDESTEKIVVSRGHSARMVRKTKEMIRMTLDNGKVVESTPEHKFYDYDKKCMVEAKDLHEGSSLLPIRFSWTNTYTKVSSPYSGDKTRVYYLSDDFNIKEGKYVAKENEHRHHIDGNIHNNNPTNIIRMNGKEHIAHHRRLNFQDPAYRDNIVNSTIEQWRTRRTEMLGYASKGGKAYTEKFNSDPEHILLRMKGLKAKSYCVCTNRIQYFEQQGLAVCGIDWDDKCDEYIKDGVTGLGKVRTIYRHFETFINFLDYLLDNRRISEEFYNKCKDRQLIYDSGVKKSVIRSTEVVYKELESRGEHASITEDNWHSLTKTCNIHQGIHWRTVQPAFGTIEGLHKHCKANHRIVKYEVIQYEEDIETYCFTVDYYHNFFLDAGVLSQNSQAELRTVAKAAGDQVLMKAYEDGIDVHMVTAMGVYRRPASEITEIQRRYTKMCCLVGDTKIRLLDGVDTIENLYNKWKESPESFEVPSYCKGIGFVAGTVVDVQLTKYTKELVKVTYTDGSTHTSTPDHWLLETGDTDYYIQVQASEGTWIEGIDYGSPTRDKTHRKLVDNVEFITLDEPVPVYDLSVDKYHNYVIDFEDGTGVFTHNTFRILYGGTAQSVADEFFNGDLESANEIFNGFFDTYYGVRDWMKERHKEIVEKGVVTTMSNRAIRLGFEAPGVDLGKIMRQAGNAPDIEAPM